MLPGVGMEHGVRGRFGGDAERQVVRNLTFGQVKFGKATLVAVTDSPASSLLRANEPTGH